MRALEYAYGGRGHLLVEAKLADDFFYLVAVLLELDSTVVGTSMAMAVTSREHCRLDDRLDELCRDTRIGLFCSMVSTLLELEGNCTYK